MRRLACVVLLASAAAPAHAQLRISGSASGLLAQHQVRFADSVRERTGVWFGAEGSVQAGRVRLGLGGLLGTLTGDAASVNPDTDVRVSWAELHLVASSALAIGAQYEVKRFESDVGVTLWTLMGLNLRVTPALGSTGLRGLADISYFASGSVVDGAAIAPAMRGQFGVTWQRPGRPLVLRLAYRFERFDFDAAGTDAPRLEQFRGALFGIGLQLGR